MRGVSGRASPEDFALLQPLPRETRAALWADVRDVRFSRGEIVIEQGDTGEDVYFLLSGALVGVLLSEEGKEIAFSDFRPGAFFGELAALDSGTRSITISAVEPSVLGRLSGAAFRGWLHRSPELAMALARELGRRQRLMIEKVYALVVHDVDKRVRLALTRLAQSAGQFENGGTLSPAPTHSAIAAHVGANREAVTRVVARLARAGVLETGRQRITFRDIDALTEGL